MKRSDSNTDARIETPAIHRKHSIEIEISGTRESNSPKKHDRFP